MSDYLPPSNMKNGSMYFNTDFHSNIKILSLNIQPMGIYHDMCLRPYETHIDQGVIEQVSERAIQFNSPRIQPGLFNGIGSSIIHPAANHSGIIQVPNGWNTQRARFVLVVQDVTPHGFESIHYIQGYTDWLGAEVGHNGKVIIANDVVFIINSLSVMTVSGQRRLLQQTQLLSNMENIDILDPNTRMSIRPFDLYHQMAVMQYSQNVKTKDLEPVVSRSGKFSRRSNSHHNKYLSEVVGSYMLAATDGFGVEGEGSVMDLAKDYSMKDGYPRENAFLRRINSLTGMFSQFDMPTLRRIDPNIDQLINFQITDRNDPIIVSSTQYTNTWDGSDVDTVNACIIANAATALAGEYGLNRLSLTSENVSTAVPLTIIYDYKSLLGENMSQQAEIFKHRLENEVIMDLTFGNQISYDLELDIDLLGETKIRLSMDGGPMSFYCSPTFMDSNFTPVIAPNEEVSDHILHDLSWFVENTSENASMSRHLLDKSTRTEQIPTNPFEQDNSKQSFIREEKPSLFNKDRRI